MTRWTLHLTAGVIGLLLALAAAAWRVLLLDRFGGDVWATGVPVVGAGGALILGAVCGVAVGAFACRRLVVRSPLGRWVWSPGVIVGALQVAAGLSLLLTPLAGLLPDGLAGEFPFVERDGVFEPTGKHRVIVAFWILLCTYLPCVWVGATLGWLTDLAGDRAAADRAAAGVLTTAAGAVLLGWLLGRFVLLGAIGPTAVLLIAAGGFVAVGAVMVLRARAAMRSSSPDAGIENSAPDEPGAGGAGGDSAMTPDARRGVVERRERDPTDFATRGHGIEPRDRHALAAEEEAAAEARSGPSRPASSVYVAAATGALLVGGFIADAAVRLRFVGADLVTSGALIVAWSLAALMLACAMGRALPAKAALLKAASLLAIGWHVLLLSRFDQIIASFNEASGGDAAEAGDVLAAALMPFGTTQAAMIMLTGLLIFPPVLLLGWWLAWSASQAPRARREPGKALGVWFGFAAIGWLLVSATPAWLGVVVALRLMLVAGAVGVALLLLLSPRCRTAWWLPALACATFAAGVYTLYDSTDARLLPRPAPLELDNAEVVARIEGEHVATLIDAGDLTIAGADTRYPPRWLFIDRTLVADVTPDALQSARLLAHVGLLSQESPRRTLLVGFGAGVTAAAAAEYDTNGRIDVLEPRRAVADLAAKFERWNGGVYDSDRVRFIDAAAPAYLRAVTEPYNVIAVSARSPSQADGAAVCTASFYELAMSRLSPGGVVTQAVPLSLLDHPIAARIIATFARSFPHALGFVGSESRLILIGGREPIDLKRMETEVARRQHTRAWGHFRPIKLMARIVMTRDAMLEQTASAPTISALGDELAWSASWPSKPLSPIHGAPGDVIALAREAELDCADELADVLTHLGRLRYHVPDYPAALLPGVAEENGATPVAGSNADWSLIARLTEQADGFMARGRFAEATLVLHDGLEQFAEQPALLLRLADADIALRQTNAARGLLERFIGLEPREPIGYGKLATLLRNDGNLPEARAVLDRAVRAAAPDPRIHVLLGDVLTVLNQPSNALLEYEKAMALDPDRITGAHQKHFDLSQRVEGDGAF